MRISADRTDPAYEPCTAGVVVMLDGERISGCVTADTDAGEIVRYIKDANGMPAHDGECFLTETLRGRVVVGLPGHAAN